MAGHLNAGLLAAALLAGAAHGQEMLLDPTRPPAAMIEVQGPAAAAAAAATTGPVLQSVLLSRERKSAIIGGERVEVGGLYGAARLVSLSDTEAVLEGPEGRTVLRLLPEAERTPAVAAPVEKRPAGSPPKKAERR